MVELRTTYITTQAAQSAQAWATQSWCLRAELRSKPRSNDCGAKG